nr:type I polyketide synthase [Amycolatopsis aidingensis]
MSDDRNLVDYLKWVTADLHDTRRRLAEVESGRHEPVAIVGMSCRFPGGVRSPEDLWRLVADGVDAISSFPADRGWDIEALSGDDRGHSRTLEGGFVDGATEFDAGFFGISPREALAMDPQQRLLLETSWEAVERAGIDPVSLRGSRTGVYAGTDGQDYANLVLMATDQVDGHAGTGVAASVLAGRVAYTLGLEGPAMTVDTACSSSLVALHSAAHALRTGECSLALAGGVTVMSTSLRFAGFTRQGVLAADGRCKAYADGADGTGWAEGVGVLVLERLSDAERNGHRVLAVVRGSAVNSDGASNGLTAPNGLAQQRVIRQALASAGLSVSDVDVVEGHGTGTSLGDPIEVQAVLATYGQDRETPLLLGSVKSNLGHTQAAAGVAGVIKMVQAMRHGRLPRTLYADEPSSHVDWSAGKVELLTEQVEWPEAGRARRVGVSSFGISGTNAHVILEQGPMPTTVADPEVVPGLVPWVVSAKSGVALSAQVERLVGGVGDVVDVGWSLVSGRSVFEHRAVLLAGGEGRPMEVARGVAGEGRTAFVFSGQGSQWLGMGRGLYGRFPVFAEAFDAVVAELGVGVREVVWGEDAGALVRTGFAQPALFALEVALFRLVESWGVRPDYVVGHSVGELAAAYVAGVLSLRDACVVVAARARLMEGLRSGGVMVAVRAGEGVVGPLLGEGVWVAAVNGPGSVVLSGERGAVYGVVEVLAGLGYQTRELVVSHAFHSGLMEPMVGEFARAIGGISPGVGEVPVVAAADVGEGFGSVGYWVRQVREPVRFGDAVVRLSELGVSRFLELGPDGSLCAAVQECAPELVAVPVLRAGRRDEEMMLRALGELYVAGVPVDWKAAFTGTGAAIVDLPTYPFQSERFWPRPSTMAGDAAGLGLVSAEHPLLGAAVTLADDTGTVLTGTLSRMNQPWLADHQVGGTVLFPGTGFLELALRAADQVGSDQVAELTVAVPLLLTEHDRVAIQVGIGAADESGQAELRIYSQPVDILDAEWTLHATGLLTAGGRTTPEVPAAEWPPADSTEIDIDGLYARLAENGPDYGPAFRGLHRVWRRGHEFFAEVALPEQLREEATGYGIHPALLDAAVQGSAFVEAEAGRGLLPFAWRGVELHARGASMLRVTWTVEGEEVRLTATDPAGSPVFSVESLVLRAASALGSAGSGGRNSLFQLDWVPLEPAMPDDGARIVAFPGAGDLGLPALPGSTAASLTELVAAPEPVPEVVLAPVTGDRNPAGVREATVQVLDLLQRWLAEERLRASRLVLITRGAVAGAGEQVSDLAAAAVWGLVRSAQTENPGQFQLIDIDGSTSSAEVLTGALATAEPQLLVRNGNLSLPRLAHLSTPEEDIDPLPWDRGGVVLVSGGTGGVGGVVARHVVSRGFGRVVLVSRRGLGAPGAVELRDELVGLGAQVWVVACDVGDRGAVGELVEWLGGGLTAVVHAAGVVGDGVVESLDGGGLGGVLRAKVDGAWNLHEATLGCGLAGFVVFSSVAGVLGAGGQGGYAAGNVFLDGLVSFRRGLGLPGVSVAWGPWVSGVGMEVDGRRVGGSGVGRVGVVEGMAMFDTATTTHHELVIAMRINAALRDRESVPPLFRGLVPTRRSAANSSATVATRTLLDRLRGHDPAERERILTELITGYAAEVLGHADSSAVRPEHDFLESGFDSLLAVQLRNKLGETLGMTLPGTVIFDHSNPMKLAAWLHDQLAHHADLTGHGTGGGTPEDSVGRLFFTALRGGKLAEGLAMLKAVAALRPTFEAPAELADLPAPVTLAEGTANPQLICISSPVAVGGVHQYVNIASHFRGNRKVVSLPLPGFAPGESLPATPEAATRVVAESVLEASDGEPFVLVGHSTAGVVAVAVAGLLEENWGVRPEGIAMLDTLSLEYGAGDATDYLQMAQDVLRDVDADEAAGDSSRLTAMALWLNKLPDMVRHATTAPKVLLRCGTDTDVPDEQRALLAPDDTVRSLDATHYSLAQEDAALTARTIEDWLDTTIRP